MRSAAYEDACGARRISEFHQTKYGFWRHLVDWSRRRRMTEHELLTKLKTTWRVNHEDAERVAGLLP